MADLIAVPLKKPSEVDIVKPLKNLIQSTYSTADKPEDYSDAINELNKLRNNAIWRAFEKYETSLEIIYRYESYKLIIIHLYCYRKVYDFAVIMINCVRWSKKFLPMKSKFHLNGKMPLTKAPFLVPELVSVR